MEVLKVKRKRRKDLECKLSKVWPETHFIIDMTESEYEELVVSKHFIKAATADDKSQKPL